MGGAIKGITIEFRGNATPLQKAIRTVETELKRTRTELSQVNKALKFNPTSVDLWRQKQQLLKQRIAETTDKLDVLKQEQKQMDAAGVDKNSAEYRKLQREIIETESQLKHFKRELNAIGNVKLKALGEQFKKIGDKMTSVGKDLTMKVTVPLAAVGAVAVNKFAEVDKIMQLTNSTMNNTAEEAELLNKAMKEAAASSTFGMQDAANATLNFARAGLTAEEAASALGPAMALAAGEGGELDTVSAGLVATINGFGDSFDNTTKYADVFANACNNSALDVNSLSNAMSVAAPIFAAAGYSVEDAALYMGIMANKGIDADKAANSLKTGMARLIDPSKEAADWMDKLELSITNADGSMKDSVTVQQELHDAFAGLSESEQIAAASAIFGKNQMAPWLALINTSTDDVAALTEALDEEGTAMEMQADMMSGFGGSIEQLKSGLDVLATSLGEALAPVIQVVVDALQRLVDWFNNLSPQMQSVIAVIGVIVAALGPVLVILGVLASSIGSIISLIGVIGPILAGLSLPILGIVAAIAAVIAIGVAVYKHWDELKAFAKNLWNSIKTIFEGIKTSITTAWENAKSKVVSTVSGLITSVKQKIQTLKDNVKSTFEAIKEKIITPIQNAKDKIQGIIDTIKGWFPINIGNIFKGLKTPHFTIKWNSKDFGPLGSVKYPTGFSVSWYKMGGIFDSPSLIGVGEAGPEAVVPLDKFWQKMDEMQAGQNIVININGANKDPVEIAEEVKRILIKETNQRRLAWQ